MAHSPDHPLLTFVQAKHYGTGRSRNVSPLWIVVHDMEAGEHSGRAESTAAYFANPGDGRTVSSHYTVDNDSVIQCVLLKDTAWTVGNAPGNNRGINWELSGFARQTRAEWLDDFGLAMFAQMAPYVRADAAKFGIPLERRTVKDLLSGKPGITSHNDLRVAFGGTTHTDPGANFPWDVFLAIMKGADMPSLDAADLAAIKKTIWYTTLAAGGTPSESAGTINLQIWTEQKRQAAVLDEILARLDAGAGGGLAPHTHDGGMTGPAVPTAVTAEGDISPADHQHVPGGVIPS